MADQTIESLSNEELRDLLIKHGQQVIGPVVKTTRKVYENKLKKILAGGNAASPNRRSTGASAVSIPATPSTPSDRSNASGSINNTPDRRGIGGSPFSPWSSGSRNTYGDPSRNDPDDDLMEGEESFRYVAPVDHDSSSGSPYTALGGSMIATPPRATKQSSPLTPPARPDFGYQDSPSTKLPSYGFSSRLPGDGIGSKSSSISYHTTGGYSVGSTEPYRRGVSQSIPATLAPKSAAPRHPYGATNENNQAIFGGFDTRSVWARSKRWIPLLMKIFVAIILIIFIAMVIKRAMRSGMGDEVDESNQLPP